MLAEIISRTVLTSLLLLVSNCQSDHHFQCPEPGSDSAGFDRVDCFPEGDPTEATCEKRACCWDKVNRQSESPLPRCFIPKGYGYFAESDPEYASGVWTAVIKRAGSLSWFGGDVDLLAVRVEEHTDRRLRIKIFDPARDRAEVRDVKIEQPESPPLHPLYNVTFTKSPFIVKVTRRSNGQVIFDTSLGALLFSDQYLQLTTRLTSSTLYGLGEHLHPQFKHDMNWKTWSIHASGKHPEGLHSRNLYGSHPVYLNLEDGGNANMVMLLNQHAMDVVLQPTPAVTFRTIGGIFDFYVFLAEWDGSSHDERKMYTDGEESSYQTCQSIESDGCDDLFPLWKATPPIRVIQEYQKAIGLPMMPPYWALGFQLSKWDYGSSSELREVIQRTRDEQIPYDVQWGDIDYMVSAQTFTINKTKYPDLAEIVNDLHEHGQKFMAIHDPGIKVTAPGEYRAYDEGCEKDIWVKDSDGNVLEGEVWPGTCVFADFTNVKTQNWWVENMKAFHSEHLPFDGFWLDMNEPTTFVYGSSKGCKNNTWNYPPYLPKIMGDVLWNRTLCMDAMQSAGRHYDLHSLYGHHMIKATDMASKSIFGEEKRSLMISRSTFVGSGRYSGKFLGDNNSSFVDMKWSITSILEFNMFGIPYVGAEIGGFFSNATEQLCQRWQQLGAFYPMARNHNRNDTTAQDPASFGEKLIEATRDVLLIRYRLLPYLYTLFHLAHTTGAPVVRPIVFEFPKDKTTEAIDRQFMWGPGFLVSPVLDNNTHVIRAYFPEGRWYSYYTGEEIRGTKKWHSLKVPLDSIRLHVRGGYILPLQQPDVNTQKSRQRPMELMVALDEAMEAEGVLFLDDGESRDTYKKKESRMVYFYAKKNELVIFTRDSEGDYDPRVHLDTIIIYGIRTQVDPTKIIVRSKPNKAKKIHLLNADWDDYTKCLTLQNLGLDLKRDHIIMWDQKRR